MAVRDLNRAPDTATSAARTRRTASTTTADLTSSLARRSAATADARAAAELLEPVTAGAGARTTAAFDGIRTLARRNAVTIMAAAATVALGSAAIAVWNRLPFGGGGDTVTADGHGHASAATDTPTTTGAADAPKANDVAPTPPVQRDHDATMAAIAENARAQVTGETDHTSDGQLNPTVAAYMRATTGIEPSLSRDWTTDFVGWVCAQAGVPIGPHGGGAVDVEDLLNWAADRGMTVPMKAAKDHLEPGQLLITIEPGATDLKGLDIGVITSVDGDQLSVTYGNRWVADGGDGGSDVGAVRTVILNRNSPGLLGIVDVTSTRAPEAPDTPITPPTSKPRPGDSHITTASVRRKGTPPPVASATTPTRAQLDNYFNWAASQYAHSDAQARELANVMKNVAAVETHFGVNALNLWDSNAIHHVPSFGMFQFIKPTYDGFSSRARAANPPAWKQLGNVTWGDWRAQALTTSWALAQSPTDFSRANNGWSGQHGRYWSRWSSIKNMVNGNGSVPQGDPRTSRYWKKTLSMSYVEDTRNRPVERRTVYPAAWKAAGKRLSPEQLHEVVRTGQVYGIPRPGGGS